MKNMVDKKMKVISFKVNDDTYFILKKIMKTKNLSFRSIFEPIAVDLAQNINDETKYTPGIRKNSENQYIDDDDDRKVNVDV